MSQRNICLQKGIGLLSGVAFFMNVLIPPSMAQPFSQSLSVQAPVLNGMMIHSENPFRFDFIVERGMGKMDDADLKRESLRLIKYFLASMTIPDQEAWVNLSPYEKDRVIPVSLGQTEMGKVMLQQDYQLKQLAASLTNPNTDLGRKYWDMISPRDAGRGNPSLVSKVWIMPAGATVVEKNGFVYISASKLKVMMDGESEQDNVFRRLVLPDLERAVNTSQSFMPTRQIYQSVILAAWYKRALKDSFLGRNYADQAKLAGVKTDDKDFQQKIYEQYLTAFKKGAYEIIKEQEDEDGHVVPRKYFSGGVNLGMMNLDPKDGLIVTSAASAVQAALQSVASSTQVVVQAAVKTELLAQGDSDRSIRQVLNQKKFPSELMSGVNASSGVSQFVTLRRIPLDSIIKAIAENHTAIQYARWDLKTNMLLYMESRIPQPQIIEKYKAVLFGDTEKESFEHDLQKMAEELKQAPQNAFSMIRNEDALRIYYGYLIQVFPNPQPLLEEYYYRNLIYVTDDFIEEILGEKIMRKDFENRMKGDLPFAQDFWKKAEAMKSFRANRLMSLSTQQLHAIVSHMPEQVAYGANRPDVVSVLKLSSDTEIFRKRIFEALEDNAFLRYAEGAAMALGYIQPFSDFLTHLKRNVVQFVDLNAPHVSDIPELFGSVDRVRIADRMSIDSTALLFSKFADQGRWTLFETSRQSRTPEYYAITSSDKPRILISDPKVSMMYVDHIIAALHASEPWGGLLDEQIIDRMKRNLPASPDYNLDDLMQVVEDILSPRLIVARAALKRIPKAKRPDLSKLVLAKLEELNEANFAAKQIEILFAAGRHSTKTKVGVKTQEKSKRDDFYLEGVHVAAVDEKEFSMNARSVFSQIVQDESFVGEALAGDWIFALDGNRRSVSALSRRFYRNPDEIANQIAELFNIPVVYPIVEMTDPKIINELLATPGFPFTRQEVIGYLIQLSIDRTSARSALAAAEKMEMDWEGFADIDEMLSAYEYFQQLPSARKLNIGHAVDPNLRTLAGQATKNNLLHAVAFSGITKVLFVSPESYIEVLKQASSPTVVDRPLGQMEGVAEMLSKRSAEVASSNLSDPQAAMRVVEQLKFLIRHRGITGTPVEIAEEVKKRFSDAGSLLLAEEILFPRMLMIWTYVNSQKLSIETFYGLMLTELEKINAANYVTLQIDVQFHYASLFYPGLGMALNPKTSQERSGTYFLKLGDKVVYAIGDIPQDRSAIQLLSQLIRNPDTLKLAKEQKVAIVLDKESLEELSGPFLGSPRQIAARVGGLLRIPVIAVGMRDNAAQPLSPNQVVTNIQKALSRYPDLGKVTTIFLIADNQVVKPVAENLKKSSSSGIADRGDLLTESGRTELNPGGIDFNSTTIDLQIKGDGKGIPLPLKDQNLEKIRIEGLSPIIINILPVNAQSLPILGQLNVKSEAALSKN